MKYELLEQLQKVYADLQADGWEHISDYDTNEWRREFEVGDFEVEQFINPDSLEATTKIVSIIAQQKAVADRKEWDLVKAKLDEQWEREFCIVNSLNYEEETKITGNDYISMGTPLNVKLRQLNTLVILRGDASDADVEAELERAKAPKWIEPPRPEILPYPFYPQPIEFDYIIPRDITEAGIKALIVFQ